VQLVRCPSYLSTHQPEAQSRMDEPSLALGLARGYVGGGALQHGWFGLFFFRRPRCNYSKGWDGEGIEGRMERMRCVRNRIAIISMCTSLLCCSCGIELCGCAVRPLHTCLTWHSRPILSAFPSTPTTIFLLRAADC